MVQTLHLRAAAPTLQWRHATPFPGARLALLPGGGKRPAVIALGGSEGGSRMVSASAALLASHGFAVLALPYYSPPGFGVNGPTAPEVAGLPTAFADIPVDRLDAARAWLAQQPEVDASRIALYGVSKGAEFALLAASRMAWPKAVVAIVPSDVVWEGWGLEMLKAEGTRSSFSCRFRRRARPRWNCAPCSWTRRASTFNRGFWKAGRDGGFWTRWSPSRRP